ncbi:hypothetical protein N9241_01270 [bacterium]|nr:hypothetical protein [bacterium]
MPKSITDCVLRVADGWKKHQRVGLKIVPGAAAPVILDGVTIKQHCNAHNQSLFDLSAQVFFK